MAGITAVSTSKSHTTTAVDTNVGGFVTGEQIALATDPTGSTYSWSIAKPGGATARSDLTSTTAAAPKFTPDSAGYYVVSVTVDSTTIYVLRINVTQTAVADTVEALRFSPKADADVPTPPLGVAQYHSNDASMPVEKDTGGTVWSQGSMLKSYTVVGLPSAVSQTGRLVFVSDEAGGATVAVSNGTNWVRLQDLATVS